MTQAVASSGAMRDLQARMASATDEELVAIAKKVAASAWSVVDSITENPFTALFDSKSGEIAEQQSNLRAAITAVNDSTINGRDAIIQAVMFLQASIETTNTFYADNPKWNNAVSQFADDLVHITGLVADEVIKHAIGPITSGIWHRFRWYIIALGLLLVTVLILAVKRR